jgi:hypothetical protein
MAPKSESSADNLFRWLGFFIGWLFTGIIGLFAILIDMISSANWNRSVGVSAEQLALEKQRAIEGPFGSTASLQTTAASLTTQAAFPSADQFIDAFIERYNNDTQPVGRVLAFKARIDLLILAHNLYAAEHFNRPPSHAVITGMVDAGRYRDELIAHMRKIGDPPKALEVFTNCVAQSAIRLTEAVSPIALQEFADRDTDAEAGTSIPLVEVIRNLPDAIEKIIAPFSDPEAIALGLFKKLRQVLQTNRDRYDALKVTDRDPRMLLKETELDRVLDAQIPFALPEETRFAGHWCIAPPGRGKTTLLHSMVLEDICPSSDNLRQMAV